jgi:hypothetical protein
MGRLYGFGDAIVAGGFFLINREHHLPVLRLAEALQPRDNAFHGRRNPEEIALSSALAMLRTPIAYLDRRYNWLRFGEGKLGLEGGAIVAHACNTALRRHYLRQTLPDYALPAVGCSQILPEDLSDETFIYDRVGHDLRPLELRGDGTIGRGGGNAERYWFVTTRDGVRTLVLSGIQEETCALMEDDHGVWHGQWTRFERMRVTLEKHRAQVLIDLVRGTADSTAANVGLRGAEIGVFRGETSALLLSALPSLHLYMVDPWRQVAPGSEYALTGDECAALSQADFDDAMNRAAAATRFAADRRTMVACDQSRAAAFVPDGLDFIFIDGDHGYRGTRSAIAKWWPKLAPGGLLAGHDYDHPRFPGVTRAVQDFARRNRLRVSIGPDRTWWYAPCLPLALGESANEGGFYQTSSPELSRVLLPPNSNPQPLTPNL